MNKLTCDFYVCTSSFVWLYWFQPPLRLFRLFQCGKCSRQVFLNLGTPCLSAPVETAQLTRENVNFLKFSRGKT